MKKILCLALVLAFAFSAAASAESMLVHISAICYDANHVGKDWKGYFSIGDYQIFDGDVIELDMAKYILYSEITDYDATPDVGFAEKSVNVTRSRLEKGFTVDQVLTVQENQGAYTGYWTEWYVSFSFTPVSGAWVLDCRY